MHDNIEYVNMIIECFPTAAVAISKHYTVTVTGIILGKRSVFVHHTLIVALALICQRKYTVHEGIYQRWGKLYLVFYICNILYL